MSQVSFEDFTGVTRRVYEYAYGIDTKDWALYRSIFSDQVAMNFHSYNGLPERSMTADEWVAGCQSVFMGLDATQHTMSNPLVEVVGDHARCRMSMQATHFLITDQGSNEYTLGGFYDDRLLRTDHGWQIEAVTLNVLWHRGNRQIMDLAVERAANSGVDQA